MPRAVPLSCACHGDSTLLQAWEAVKWPKQPRAPLSAGCTARVASGQHAAASDVAMLRCRRIAIPPLGHVDFGRALILSGYSRSARSRYSRGNSPMLRNLTPEACQITCPGWSFMSIHFNQPMKTVDEKLLDIAWIRGSRNSLRDPNKVCR